MRNKYLNVSICFKCNAMLFLCLSMGSANAVLISTDDTVFGSNSITLDTQTNLEWLDIDLTVSRSFNYISASFGDGMEYEGFRYASMGEVWMLWNNANIPIIVPPERPTQVSNPNKYYSQNFQPIKDLTTMIGLTGGGITSGQAIGMTADLHPTEGISYAANLVWDERAFVGGGGLADLSQWSHSLDQPQTYIGSYLVKTSVVPLPPAVFLFSSGLLVLFSLKKKKK